MTQTGHLSPCGLGCVPKVKGPVYLQAGMRPAQQMEADGDSQPATWGLKSLYLGSDGGTSLPPPKTPHCSDTKRMACLRKEPLKGHSLPIPSQMPSDVVSHKRISDLSELARKSLLGQRIEAFLS